MVKAELITVVLSFLGGQAVAYFVGVNVVEVAYDFVVGAVKRLKGIFHKGK